VVFINYSNQGTCQDYQASSHDLGKPTNRLFSSFSLAPTAINLVFVLGILSSFPSYFTPVNMLGNE